MENAENCKDCRTPITFAYREWWDENDDNTCPKGGTHFPYFKTELAPTPVFSTSGPIAKNREKRFVPLRAQRAQRRGLVTDA